MFFSSDLAYQSCCLSGMLTLGEARDYNVPFTDIRGCNRKRPTPKMMVGQMKASVIVLCHLLVKKYLSQKSQWTQQPGIYLSKIFYQGTPRLWFHSRGHCSQRSCHRELGVSTGVDPKRLGFLLHSVSLSLVCPCAKSGRMAWKELWVRHQETWFRVSPAPLTGCVLTSLSLFSYLQEQEGSCKLGDFTSLPPVLTCAQV